MQNWCFAIHFWCKIAGGAAVRGLWGVIFPPVGQRDWAEKGCRNCFCDSLRGYGIGYLTGITFSFNS